MALGTDFIKIFHFVVAIVRLIIKVFGDKDDNKTEDNYTNNHDTDCQKVIDSA